MLATYTSARPVREALEAAGFDVELRSGYGGKRHRLVARFAPRYVVRRHEPPAPYDGARRGVVIGAGLAGAACAEALARRGWQVRSGRLLGGRRWRFRAALGPAASALCSRRQPARQADPCRRRDDDCDADPHSGQCGDARALAALRCLPAGDERRAGRAMVHGAGAATMAERVRAISGSCRGRARSSVSRRRSPDCGFRRAAVIAASRLGRRDARCGRSPGSPGAASAASSASTADGASLQSTDRR